eukprot:364111-Chlamydomonas_euryale.AAC.25
MAEPLILQQPNGERPRRIKNCSQLQLPLSVCSPLPPLGHSSLLPSFSPSVHLYFPLLRLPHFRLLTPGSSPPATPASTPYLPSCSPASSSHSCLPSFLPSRSPASPMLPPVNSASLPSCPLVPLLPKSTLPQVNPASPPSCPLFLCFLRSPLPPPFPPSCSCATSTIDPETSRHGVASAWVWIEKECGSGPGTRKAWGRGWSRQASRQADKRACSNATFYAAICVDRRTAA